MRSNISRTQDGLAHDQIFFIQKDRQERLWFSTLKGVCWYDGADFHHLEDDGIAGRPVQFIYEDRQSRIWFGGAETLGYYDGAVFYDLTPLYLQQHQQLFSSSWPSFCRGIAQDPQDHLWFGFENLIRFDGESFHRYEADDGFPRIRAGYAVGQNHTGKVWIGWIQDGRFHFHDNSTQSIKVGLNCKLRRMMCDQEGRMWFCTLEGAFYQDDDGFSRFTAADGLPHSVVKSMFQDREHQFGSPRGTALGGTMRTVSTFSTFVGIHFQAKFRRSRRTGVVIYGLGMRLLILAVRSKASPASMASTLHS